MLNRGTLLLLLIAITLGGGVLLFENSDSAERARNADETVGEAQGKPLLPFEESAITRFTLSRSNQSDLAFVKDESGVWQMSAPEETIAEGGAIAFLLSQITRPSNRVITAESNNLVDFGLEDPEATITLEATASEAEKHTYQLLLGGADFGGDQRYVQVIELMGQADATSSDENSSNEEVDSANLVEAEESSEMEIHLVSGGIANAIERPVPDWISNEEGEATDSTTQP
ncbi:hypothetical protein S7335_3726 [Synechococcus sp. PCC 7335]|uniref:DUF4340 domain-containing protein n=1 Tax=Synechococcus sp. (strain ATCC 29403 / PCC 7335) TaxID=91464 RepID=UPI00017EE01F|nr:DUF4340 domain-containing protein [Synechococcus sp. PCC 7335]EDX86023.1 hypothetical protein S7335_3726 [Synechococcus sp. PCC 7335]